MARLSDRWRPIFDPPTVPGESYLDRYVAAFGPDFGPGRRPSRRAAAMETITSCESLNPPCGRSGDQRDRAVRRQESSSLPGRRGPDKRSARRHRHGRSTRRTRVGRESDCRPVGHHRAMDTIRARQWRSIERPQLLLAWSLFGRGTRRNDSGQSCDLPGVSLGERASVSIRERPARSSPERVPYDNLPRKGIEARYR